MRAPLPTALPEWRALAAHAATLRGRHLRELFAEDPTRGERLAADGAGLYLDYAKQRVDDQALRLLLQLAAARDLDGHRAAMFRGETINQSEHRAALHVALRASPDARIFVDGRDVVPAVQATLERMQRFCAALHEGRWTGWGGRPIRRVVNLGIGGSDLGPALAHQALRAQRLPGLDFRFVANLDPAALDAALAGLDAAETLFIVCSKSFGTLETLENARAARAWLLDRLGPQAAAAGAVARHFVAVSSRPERVAEFGIDPQNTFGFDDWVGGRYSLASAIGLSTMLAIGGEGFRELLAGMRAMDEHFLAAPAARNLPVLMGLLAVWNVNFLDVASIAVLPYAEDLHRLPAYLQQLAMESNGKRVTRQGLPVDYATAPIWWGEAGSSGQHSFHQLLHQGTAAVACDFIGFCRSASPRQSAHDLLMANLFAQAETLAFGRDAESLRCEGVPEALIAQRLCVGNRPSSTLLAEQLGPRSLGALIALYEHAVFTQGVIWNLNSFDQWGVELGKQLASRTAAELAAAAEPALAHDGSTNALIRRYRRGRV